MLKSNQLNTSASFRFIFRKIINRNLMVSIISGVFCLLLISAAVVELMNFQAFGNQIAESNTLAPFASYLVWLVPVVEFMIVGLLLSSRTILIGLYACCCLMILFSIYTIIILVAAHFPSFSGIFANIECKSLLLFNVALVMLALAGITLKRTLETRYNF